MTWSFEVEFPTKKIISCSTHEDGSDYHEPADSSDASPEILLKLTHRILRDIRGTTQV